MYNPEFHHADVAKLVDAPDLGSGAERCESSSLSVRTTLKMSSFRAAFFTSIPLYTLFKIKTAFNFLTFAKKGFIWGYNRRFHFIFQTAYHLC